MTIKHHPVLKNPWEYEIVGFSYRRDMQATQESTLELTLAKDGITKKLRFTDPRDIKVEPPFPNVGGPSDIYIADISERGWEGIAIEVGGVEQDARISFCARDVFKIDE